MTEFADRVLMRNGAPSSAADLLAAVEAESVVRVADAELLQWLAAHLPADRFVVRKLSDFSVSAALAELSEYVPIQPEPAAPEPAAPEPAAPEPAAPEPLTLDSLLSALKAALLARAAAARAACDEAFRTTGTVDPQMRALAETHAPGVAALLDGPTKDALLLGTARAPSALAALAAGEPGEFVPAHFEFAAVPSHRLTDVKVQRYVQKLKTNTQGERATAAALANEVRDEVLAARVAITAPPKREPEQVYAETVRAIHDSGRMLAFLSDAPESALDALRTACVRFAVLGTTEDAFALAPVVAPEPVLEVAPTPEPVLELEPVTEVAPAPTEPVSEPTTEPAPVEPESIAEVGSEVAESAEPEPLPVEPAPEVPLEAPPEPPPDVAPEPQPVPDALPEPEVPADLRAFLDAVANGGAPLELVTPMVLGWLRARGELGAFVVRSVAELDQDRPEEAEKQESGEQQYHPSDEHSVPVSPAERTGPERGLPEDVQTVGGENEEDKRQPRDEE